MSLEVVLLCDTCGKRARPKPYYRWAPWGVLEVSAATDFYVDGAHVRCREHADPRDVEAQRHGREIERATCDRATG